MSETDSKGSSTIAMFVSLVRAVDSVFPGHALTIALRVEMDGQGIEMMAEFPARGETPKGAA